MTTDDNTTLAYDLRQKYAEITGIHLEAVAMARIKRDYLTYYSSLEDLYTVISHKFKEEKRADPINYPKELKKKDVKRTDVERREELIREVVNISNQYQNEFLGKTTNPEANHKIEKALRDLERFYYAVMSTANMFGTTGYNEGL